MTNVVIGLFFVFIFLLGLLLSGNLVFFWLYLELVGLSVIPCFFYLYCDLSFYTLFVYIIVSSVSSFLVLLGIIDGGLVSLFILGLVVKFGLFPFIGWVYTVVLGSNSLIIWLLSVFLKVPFVYVCFFLSGYIMSGFSCVYFLVSVSFLILSFVFWLYSYSWRCCWCHMLIVSSGVLLLSSFIVSLDILVYFFIVYSVWCTLVILFLFFNGSLDDNLFGVLGFKNSGCFGLLFVFCYVFLLLTTPCSFSLVYKILSACCLYSMGVFVLLTWVVYSLSEQFYLLKYLLSCVVVKFNLNWFKIV